MKRQASLLRVGAFALACVAGVAFLGRGLADDQKGQLKLPPKTTNIQQVQPLFPPNAVPAPPAQFQPIPPNGFQGGFPVQGGFGGPNGGPNFIGGLGGKGGPAPQVAAPQEITTREGKKGWKVVIPGNRPLATPAVVDGKVFVGGGFGSYEFYCFDGKSGKQVWMYRTGDDGPTAAVVSDGYIAFNTESCELEIITMDGKKVWKKWLGDPLMSMPAIHKGKIYMSYPNSKGNNKHHMACFDLKTVQQFWDKEIPAQIITAPVISKGNVYASTLDGSMTCLDTRDGTLVWQDKKNATSSPVVWNGKVFFSRRDAVNQMVGGKQVVQQMEELADRPIAPKGEVKSIPATTQPADYLDLAKRELHSKEQGKFKAYDGSVGFGVAPAGAGLGMGGFNIAQNTVSGVWSYQGSKPFVYNNLLYSSMGCSVKCVDPDTQKVKWQTELKDKNAKGPLVDASLTPPAIVNGKLFIGTSAGDVLCYAAQDGKLLWRVTVSEPIVFQPAVANGRVYVSTSTGSLYSFDTGDAKDHGWLMWGGNSEHNGLLD